LVLRSDYPIWVTTGGGIEKNESPEVAALREAYEETGFKIKITRKVGVYSKKHKGVPQESHLFEGRVISGKFKPEFPECKGKWFLSNKLPISMTEISKVRIADCLSKKNEFPKDLKYPSLNKNLRLIILHPVSFLKYIFIRTLKSK